MLYGDWEGASMTYEEKRATIEKLLDHWDDYHAPGGSLKGGGDGEGTATISSMATEAPVVELTRCLEMCRRMAPGHYKHLLGHYGSEWRLVNTTVKVQNAQRKWVEKPARLRERVVPSWVLWRMVDRALDFLLGVWDNDVVMELPVQLRRAQTQELREFVDPVTGEHGWTMAA